MFQDDYSNQTTIAPIGLLLITIIVILVLARGKDHIFLSFVIISCFVSSAQRIIVAGLDFTFLRIVVLFIFLRIIFRKEWRIKKLHIVDRLVILYAVISVVAYTVSRQGFSAFVSSLGDAFDTIGAYFIFRNYIYNIEIFKKFIRNFALSSILILPLFFYENKTGINLFSYFGGVNYNSIVRLGKVRSQGAFVHPIIAGTFWAVLIPLYWGLWGSSRLPKYLIILSTASSLGIILFCASSTPVMSFAAGFGFLLLYPLRSFYKYFKYSFFVMLAFLQSMMNHPIWYIMSMIDIAGGSTGAFRYLLIDRFVYHWREWFFFGIIDTYHWGEGYGLPSVGLRDLTNRFVAEGVFGGIGRLLLFIIIFIIAIRIIESVLENSHQQQLFLWAILAHILVHFMNFWGVTYFGQMSFMYWLTIAVCVNVFYSDEFFRNLTLRERQSQSL